MERILAYAQQRNYTKYTSTLKEAWRLSISGLSSSLVELIKMRGEAVELGPEEDYTCDPATLFGTSEAKRHRERGINLGMFLGLMKYYHQSYQDLIKESEFNSQEKQIFSNIINRFFDRVEISFCIAWTSSNEGQFISELQDRNRLMTNEKNKYLTFFESLSDPVLIVDSAGKIENINFSASSLFFNDSVPGERYYAHDKRDIKFIEKFPWLANDYDDFLQSKKEKAVNEKYLESKKKYFHVIFSQFLDISGKFSGTIIIIVDMTKRIQMEKELERLATTDPLTGAKNRRAFLQFFKQELARGQRYGHKLALLVLDIDHFKKINDTYGHDTGDQVLQVLVDEAHGVLRRTDIFGRWGGEEFIIVLPESDINQAVGVAERLRTNFSALTIRTEDDSVIQFTVSIGMTLIENNYDHPDDFIVKADKALYMAKEQGRNRIVVV
ncbi:diguanylate cyclase [Desulfobulbus rhabdoformis]|nr:diguanylate cyclase [Desulfobulbus rhabdoformis]